MLQDQPRATAQDQDQPREGPTPMDAQDVSFWLGKAEEWGRADRPETERDSCLHLTSLRAFLYRLLTHISNMGSSREAVRRQPLVGRLLGRLCWNSYVTADAETLRLLLSSVWTLYSEEPASAVERKANQWIRSMLCQWVNEAGDGDGDAPGLERLLGRTLPQRHVQDLQQMVSDLVKKVGPSCRALAHPKERFPCDRVLPASVACVPLVTCPQAAPLIGTLLQRPVTCDRAALSQDFLDAVSSAYSRKCVFLEQQTVVSLWCHSLPSLEGAVVSLLESTLSNTHTTPQGLELLLSSSLLPKACAQHCSVFLILADIFRSMLMQVEGNHTLLSLVHMFTCCLLSEIAALQPQELVPLKSFFPCIPQSLLAPLLTHPSEMPQEAWPDHVGWLSGSLLRIIQEEEVEGDSRGSCGVLEAWFVLVQCGYWAEVAGQLLVSAGAQDRAALLWMLTLYHHPTNRGHHRERQLVAAGEAWNHLRSLFLVSSPPPDRLKVLVELLVARPEQLSLAPLLVLRLLLNCAVFSHGPGAVEIVRTVVEQTGLWRESEWILSSMELRLNRGICSSTHTHTGTVQPRIRELQDTLAHERTTHTHSQLLAETRSVSPALCPFSGDISDRRLTS